MHAATARARAGGGAHLLNLALQLGHARLEDAPIHFNLLLTCAAAPAGTQGMVKRERGRTHASRRPPNTSHAWVLLTGAKPAAAAASSSSPQPPRSLTHALDLPRPALALEVGPHAREAGQLVLALRQLHLCMRGGGAGSEVGRGSLARSVAWMRARRGTTGTQPPGRRALGRAPAACPRAWRRAGRRCPGSKRCGRRCARAPPARAPGCAAGLRVDEGLGRGVEGRAGQAPGNAEPAGWLAAASPRRFRTIKNDAGALRSPGESSSSKMTESAPVAPTAATISDTLPLPM